MEQQERTLSDGERLAQFKKKLIDEINHQIRMLQAQGNIDTENYDLNALLNKVRQSRNEEELKRVQSQLFDITENRNLR